MPNKTEIIVITEKQILATPFVVAKAMFTLLKSLGFTKRCWYTNIDTNNAAPIQ
jgi:hypothetical protein